MHQSAACGPDPTWVQYTRIGPRKKPRRPNTSQTCEPEKQTSRVRAAARSRRTGLLPVLPRPQPDQAGRRRLLAYARTRLGWEAGLDALSDARRRVGCVPRTHHSPARAKVRRGRTLRGFTTWPQVAVPLRICTSSNSTVTPWHSSPPPQNLRNRCSQPLGVPQSHANILQSRGCSVVMLY